MWAQFNRYSSFGSDNDLMLISDLVPIRRQAIIRTNDEYFTDAYPSPSMS